MGCLPLEVVEADPVVARLLLFGADDNELLLLPLTRLRLDDEEAPPTDMELPYALDIPPVGVLLVWFLLSHVDAASVRFFEIVAWVEDFFFFFD